LKLTFRADWVKLIVDISILLNAIGAVQGFTMAVVFWRKNNNRLTNRLLAGLLLAFALIVFNTVIILAGYAPQFPFYQDFSNACILLITPLIYLYVQTISGQECTGKQITLHLAPFLFYGIFLLAFHLTSLVNIGTKELVSNLAFFALNIQIIIYLTLSFNRISNFDSNVRESYSNLHGIGLDWIKVILISFSIAYVLHFILLVLETSGMNIPQYVRLNVTLLWAMHMFAIAYIRVGKRDSLDITFIPKYKSSTLSSNEVRTHLEKIQEAMLEEKLYLKPTLTIAEFADQLQLQSRHVSQVINQELGKNFYDFVNTYRVEEVKEKLLGAAYSNFTILGIAKECGFQSGSAFNTAFKKNTGTSPSAFKKKISLSKLA
jgi:AraC-like DNA-binding protein